MFNARNLKCRLVRNITVIRFFQNSAFAIFEYQIVGIMIIDCTQYIGYWITLQMICHNFLRDEYDWLYG